MAAPLVLTPDLIVPPAPTREPPDYARLDQERNERDRAAHRGYDYDCTAPSHREYLARAGKDCPCLHRR